MRAVLNRHCDQPVEQAVERRALRPAQSRKQRLRRIQAAALYRLGSAPALCGDRDQHLAALFAAYRF